MAPIRTRCCGSLTAGWATGCTSTRRRSHAPACFRATQGKRLTGPRQGRGSSEGEGQGAAFRIVHRPRYVAPSVARPLRKGRNPDQEGEQAHARPARRTRLSGLLHRSWERRRAQQMVMPKEKDQPPRPGISEEQHQLVLAHSPNWRSRLVGIRCRATLASEPRRPAVASALSVCTGFAQCLEARPSRVKGGGVCRVWARPLSGV
jgi:hypothetical protein